MTGLQIKLEIPLRNVEITSLKSARLGVTQRQRLLVSGKACWALSAERILNGWSLHLPGEDQIKTIADLKPTETTDPGNDFSEESSSTADLDLENRKRLHQRDPVGRLGVFFSPVNPSNSVHHCIDGLS